MSLGFGASTACTPPDRGPAICGQQNGKYVYRTVNEGVIRGICIFPDNTECNAKDFADRRCKPGDVRSTQLYTSTVGVPMLGLANGASVPDSFAALIGPARLIFVGEVGEVIQHRSFAGYGPGGELLDGINDSGVPSPTVPFTDFAVKIERIVRDDGSIASGKRIVLRMHGDATAETKKLTQGSDYPFSYTGDRYLFLLSPNPDGTYGFYYGPWSRLIIVGSTLHVSDAAQEPFKPVGSDVAISLEEFIQQVNQK